MLWHKKKKKKKKKEKQKSRRFPPTMYTLMLARGGKIRSCDKVLDLGLTYFGN